MSESAGRGRSNYTKAETMAEEVDIPTPHERRLQRKSINFIHMAVERTRRAFLGLYYEYTEVMGW